MNGRVRMIEIGVPQQTGDSFTKKGEDFWDNYPSSYNSTISPDDIKLFIGRIFQYGYTGTISTSWRSQNEGGDKLAHAVATQLLIWETVIGERDENFNKVSTGGKDAVLDQISPNHPLYDKIMSYYNSMAASVQKHSKLPSFLSKTPGSAQEIELEWDGSKYTVTLTDSNNVLSGYAGAGFQIYDSSGNLITMEFTYPTPTTVETFYTDANGSLVTPEKLPYGQGYSIVEVQSPYGYVLDSTPVYFDVTEENSSEESGVTVIKVEKTNMPQKGTISIEKTGEVFFGVLVSGGTDENGQELPVIYQPIYETQGLPDTVYEIRAAEDVVTPDGTLRYSKGELVDTVTTDETGFAKSKELYLGKYEVKEVKAGYGMVLSSEVHVL